LREMRGVLAGTGRPTPKTLIEIVEMCGRCRATVIRWLKALEMQGFVRRGVVIHGGGRPRALYHPTQLLLTPPKLIEENVAIAFSKFQQMCKHEKGRWCKAWKTGCQASSCPYIVRF